jgi:hypothetical protein
MMGAEWEMVKVILENPKLHSATHVQCANAIQ